MKQPFILNTTAEKPWDAMGMTQDELIKIVKDNKLTSDQEFALTLITVMHDLPITTMVFIGTLIGGIYGRDKANNLLATVEVLVNAIQDEKIRKDLKTVAVSMKLMDDNDIMEKLSALMGAMPKDK